MSELTVRLDEMQARCDAATPGPWEAEGSQVWCIDSLVAAVRDHSVSERRPDANFIASSRTDMPKAIAALRAVLASHHPVEVEPSDTLCGHCSYQLPSGRFLGKLVEYPCPTVKSIAEALGVEQ